MILKSKISEEKAISENLRKQLEEERAVRLRSLLLETRPEILWHIYSFLELKDALILRHFNNTTNDLYQYSFVMNYDTLNKRGLSELDDSWNFFLPMSKQTRALCNADSQNLRAVLRNESLDPDFICDFIENLVHFSTTDNAQAVSILLQDGRSHVSIDELEYMLKKDFTAMAAVLQHDERLKKDIQICAICSNNIGCYVCNVEGAKICRECFITGRENRSCAYCNTYLCPLCFELGNYSACENCQAMECFCPQCSNAVIIECARCNRQKCLSCIKEDGDVWFPLDDNKICPTCVTAVLMAGEN